MSEPTIQQKLDVASEDELPEGWKRTTLGAISTFELGRTPARKEKAYWDGGKYPWVTISDMREQSTVLTTNEMITERALQECFGGELVERGTLLMSFKLTIGRTAILGIDAGHNEAIVSIYPGDEVLKDYLFYYLPTLDYTQYQDKAIKGNTLNKTKIGNIVVTLPPVAAQQEIIEILSRVTTLQELCSLQEKLMLDLSESLAGRLFSGRYYHWRVGLRSSGII